MRKILYALILAGALIPATAQAQELPPGYTTQEEFVDAPMPATKDCAHGRAKLLRFHVRDYNSAVLRQSLKLAGCAKDGHIYWSNRVDNRWTGGHGRFDYFGATVKYGGACCGGNGRYAHATQNYVFHGVIDNYWVLKLHIKMHVGGPGRGNNDIWFSKWSSFDGGTG